MNIVELFSGSASISKEFKKRGHKVFTIDIRRRKGICEPSLKKNILQVSMKDIPFKKVHVLWASPPCDIFSKASASISKEFKKRGHKVFTIDIRRRKGICEPSLKKNILQVSMKDIPFKKVHVLWASPPCDIFSKASASFHWDKEGKPKTEKCHIHLRILKKSLVLIEKIIPDTFFIENPDGKMKYQKELVNFLIRNNAMTKKVNYSDYGFPTLKPTTIFTNALDYKPKNTSNNLKKTKAHYFGESTPGNFDNLTKCQRQTIPDELVKEIVDYCEEKFK